MFSFIQTELLRIEEAGREREKKKRDSVKKVIQATYLMESLIIAAHASTRGHQVSYLNIYKASPLAYRLETEVHGAVR